MLFTKENIAEHKGKSFIECGNYLDRFGVKKYFYDSCYGLEKFFSDINIRYCKCNMYQYQIVTGSFIKGIEFIDKNNFSFYMFISANSVNAPAQSIAVGKALNGIIYLICESYPNYKYSINIIEIPEEFIGRDELRYIPKIYNKDILLQKSKDEIIEQITDEDVKRLNFAYDGVIAFNELLKEINN